MGTGFVGGIGTLRYEVIKVIEGPRKPREMCHLATKRHISYQKVGAPLSICQVRIEDDIQIGSVQIRR
jgi:hypothetical protein